MSRSAVEDAVEAGQSAKRQGPFQLLRARGRLHVPFFGDGDPAGGSDGVIDRNVKRSGALLSKVPDGTPLPHAPEFGRVAETLKPVVVCGGREMSAVAFDVTTLSEGSGGDSDADAVAASVAHPIVSEAASNANLAAIADELARLGVWIDRWASPDLLKQLRTRSSKPIDTIICNVLDEDPVVPLQVSVAAEHAGEIIAGLRTLVAAATHNDPEHGAVEVHVLLVLGYGTPTETWEALRAAAGAADPSDVEFRLRIVPMYNAYPQPNPILLIHELTGRHVRWGESPATQGVIFLDAAAAAAVGRALDAGEPMIGVPIAFRDYVQARTHLAIAPVGLSIGDALAQLGIDPTGVEMRAGCPLRELRARPDHVIAGGGELTISLSQPETRVNPDPCIRCAWCVEGCPVRIQPAGLLEAAQQEDLYAAAQLGLDACIECGICSFVCPSHLPLLRGIRVLRTQATRSRKR